jgi:pimeloyl-ACP methyl ester carboxylesterase
MLESRSFGPFFDYYRDSWQRSILFLDILRQRGNIYQEHNAEVVPNVLDFETELIVDGRSLAKPVNFGLVRIVPSANMPTNPRKRPFVVVDPRAGHGPGIGGMKKDSEIGVALAAGHPCYFIGFAPKPVPGQTLEDVWNAQAAFVAEVVRRHPDADGKPAVIANCQAGWQTVIMAATHPEVAGPLVLVGSPLSYWAGVRGKNPMRYLGGMLGGTWMTEMAGDLGAGIFDGANLVANFESLNPANTWWTKPYNVYANVDTEAERFLDFETWWGSPVLLGATEMEWIADNLFVGNKLSEGELRTTDGLRVDMRDIRSPIVVFCSWGDNITPPQQALGWITDIYRDDAEIVANGQTIVYTLHQSIGHLGIFVSGKVASREHSELTSCMDMIDVMPPGLYEAVITEVDAATENPGLVDGRYLFTLYPRSLNDIRALGGNSAEDDAKFEAVARVSEVNRHLYDLFARPIVRSVATPASAEMAREQHPNRLRFSIFSDENPFMSVVKEAAEAVRADRQPVEQDNLFLAMERGVASSIDVMLSMWGNARDLMTEQLFLQTYGSPVLQAMLGLDTEQGREKRGADQDIRDRLAQARQRTAIEQQFAQGGSVEAILRSVGYVLRSAGKVDERGFAVLRALRGAQPPDRQRTMIELKDLFRQQSLLLRIDEERAISEMAQLLPADPEERRSALAVVRKMSSAQGKLSGEGERRLARIEAIFAAPAGTPAAKRENIDAHA